MSAPTSPVSPTQSFILDRGRVVTLGAFILDHFAANATGEPTDRPTIGGGGVYAASAARLFLPPQNVGYIADCGPDLPPEYRQELLGLGDETVWLRPRGEPTTRALNLYSGGAVGEGQQSFEYLSPPKRLVLSDYFREDSPLADPPGVWVHVVCDAERAKQVLEDARACAREGWRGRLAWEPLIRGGEDVSTSTYASLARQFDVFSPNHLELQQILDTEADVETCARLFQGRMVMYGGKVPSIVVRAGAQGAFTLAEDWTGWVPAYHQAVTKIQDVTGAGNAFMGGLLAGLFATHDSRTASIWGAVAASFAIEQRGPAIGVDHMFVNARLRELTRRVDESEGVYWGEESVGRSSMESSSLGTISEDDRYLDCEEE